MNEEKESVFQLRFLYTRMVLSSFIFVYHFLIIKLERRKIFLSSAELKNISI